VALKQNRQGILAIVNALSPYIIGKPFPGINERYPPGNAIAIVPGGGRFPGRETQWLHWSVIIQTRTGIRYLASLDAFVPVSDINALFAEHLNIEINNPFRLDFRGEQRIYHGLHTAVAVFDNPEKTIFIVDWGIDQTTPTKLLTELGNGPRQLWVDSYGFDLVVTMLRNLRPIFYTGGPAPELQFEPNWLTDYQAALELLDSGQYYFVEYPLPHTLTGRGKILLLSMEIQFSKQEVLSHLLG
jgi:hypothetical protein